MQALLFSVLKTLFTLAFERQAECPTRLHTLFHAPFLYLMFFFGWTLRNHWISL
jgi:hypothetical protein